MGLLDKHGAIERNATLLLVGGLVVVSIGGIVEIAPLFYLENTIEKVEGMRPIHRSNWQGATSTFVRVVITVTAK